MGQPATQLCHVSPDIRSRQVIAFYQLVEGDDDMFGQSQILKEGQISIANILVGGCDLQSPVKCIAGE